MTHDRQTRIRAREAAGREEDEARAKLFTSSAVDRDRLVVLTKGAARKLDGRAVECTHSGGSASAPVDRARAVLPSLSDALAEIDELLGRLGAACGEVE